MTNRIQPIGQIGDAIGGLAEGVIRRAEDLGDTLTSPFTEARLRLGVTGLARAGKTVFITSLVANLMDRGRMGQVEAIREGRVETAFLQPQPDDTVPRFDFERHLAALTGPTPHWPESTSSVSELRLSLKIRPKGFWATVSGPRILHLDIIDYPGEWLLDLALLEKDYASWSAEVMGRIAARPEAAAYLKAAAQADGGAAHDEPIAQGLAAAFTEYLHAARKAGYYDCTPGRFLLPGDLAGSPALTFAPLPTGESPRGSLAREMARRFEAYKSRVVRPFFSEHFSRIDRQIVLVDALSALHSGPAALEDLRRAMGEILSAFRPGRNGVLSQILRGKRVEKILFAATKADHLHHQQHPQMTALIEALTREARDRAQFSGAETAALSLAALRATTEETRAHQGSRSALRAGNVCLRQWQSGGLSIPALCPVTQAKFWCQRVMVQRAWLDGDYQSMAFAPQPLTLRPGRWASAYPSGPRGRIPDWGPLMILYLARSSTHGCRQDWGRSYTRFEADTPWMPKIPLRGRSHRVLRHHD